MVARQTVTIIDQELLPHRLGTSIKALRTNVVTVAAVTRTLVILPGHHKAASCKTRHRAPVLRSTGITVDTELFSHGLSRRVVEPCPNIPAAATVATTWVRPYHHETTPLKRSHRVCWLRVLIIIRVGVHTELLAKTIPNRVVELTPDIPIITPLALAVVTPCNDIITTSKGRNRRIRLGT